MKMKYFGEKYKSLVILLIFSLFAIFSFCLYAPLEIYLTNRGDFWFNLRTILKYVVCFSLACTLTVTAIGFSVLKIFAEKGLRLFCSLAFAVGMIVYVQGNFLNIKLGELNGMSIEWDKYNIRMAMDILVYIVLIMIVIAYMFVNKRNTDTLRKMKTLLFISVAIMLMQLSQLVVLLVPAISDGELSILKKNILTTKEICSFGSENVVVLVVDSFDTIYINEWLQEHPEQRVLDGFTVLENYTCVYPNTIPNMSAMFAEDIFRNEKSLPDWRDEKYAGDVFWKELIKNEYKIQIYTDVQDIIPSGLRNEIVNNDFALLEVSNGRSFFHHIYRLVTCKYGPNILKKELWMNGTEFDELCSINNRNNEAYNIENGLFADYVRNARIKTEDGKVFKLIHIWGLHEPYTLDACGDVVDESDYKSATDGIMNLVDTYISSMKSEGIYDDSVFVIMGDHGNNGKHNVMSSPAFLIKQKNSTGEISYENMPASHVDFGSIILNAVDLATFEKKPEEILDKRYYYAYVYKNDDSSKIEDHGNPELVEYIIPDNSSDPWKFERTGFEFAGNGEKLNHMSYCKVCKNNETPEKYMDKWRVDYHRHSFDYPFK